MECALSLIRMDSQFSRRRSVCGHSRCQVCRIRSVDYVVFNRSSISEFIKGAVGAIGGFGVLTVERLHICIYFVFFLADLEMF